MDKYNVYQPIYYKNFKCIGSECKNNCCHGWRIFIDRNTYDKYTHIEDEAVRKELTERIEILNEKNFQAKLKLDEDRKCFFLNEDGLCSVQLRFGYDYLSNVCKSYPRLHNIIGNDIELFLVLSCEAAAKLVLFNPEIMKFDEGLLEIEGNYNATRVMDTGKYIKSENALDIFWKLRTASAFILQSRQYKFWLRMIILGIYIKKSEELLLSGEDDHFRSFSDEFIQKVDNGTYMNSENGIPNEYMVKINYIFAILKGITTISEALNNCFKQMKEGLVSVDDNQTEEIRMEHFEDIIEKYYSPFFKDKEYIYENYVMNDVLMNGFPFNYKNTTSGSDNIYSNYVNLIIKYSLLKFMLIGIAGYHKENFNDDNIIYAVISLSRLLDHNKRIIPLILEYLEKNNATTLGALCTFIKD